MSDAYGRVKGGRLTFKGGDVATRSKPIDMKKTSKKKKKRSTKLSSSDPDAAAEEILTGDAALDAVQPPVPSVEAQGGEGDGGDPAVYTIDAAKRKKYDELFPVEAKRFGYDPKSNHVKSVEDALDDRVKKKADRYCK